MTAGQSYLAMRKARRENNEKKLAETGLKSVFEQAEAALPPKPVKPKPKPKPRATHSRKRKSRDDDDSDEEEVMPRPTRRSVRAVINTRTDEELKQAIADREVREAAEAALERERKHGDRQIVTLTGVTGSGDTESLMLHLKTLSLYDSQREPRKKKAGDVAPPKPITSKEAYKELRESVENVEHRATVKIVPERIYSSVIHPDPTRDLIFVGDKGGHIGLWDATDAGMLMQSEVKAEDDDDETLDMDTEVESKGSFWHWRAHNRTISTLKFSPTSAAHIYSSSYDCTIRRTNFETGIAEEVLDGDRWDQDNLFHSFDFEPSGNVFWACDNNGGISRRDMREAMGSAKRWRVDNYKIGGISINPANSNMAVTAHLKRYMRVWDLRQLQGLPDDDLTDDLLDDCILATTEQSNAVSSAYFDPSGTKILSTSYDDKLRVFDLDPSDITRFKDEVAENPFKPSVVIPHNCQVGRYVSIFRAQWSPNPAQPLHLHIGNMKRMLDVYVPTGTKGDNFGHLTDETITAVPAITASHPSLPSRYAGGNASGKVTYFAPARD